ncbi:pentapeptide repeat-containing protein [Serratia sp. IR-2025]|uniref:pentapeptide repeat-containing protein n=1 Tax=Serratia marcescens TaxID=615 RepID=UPI001F1556D4|nr:pentapeptide repeat-containing protein [Serratia marcescens]
MEEKLFVPNGRSKEEDISFCRDMSYEEVDNRLFIRGVAKGKKFEHVNFNYCIFDVCYFRKCVFTHCNFIGCRFVGCSFNGSNFIDCDLRYAVFERTQVDVSSLSESAPNEENLRAKFFRSLRVNYQQQGDTASVNFVIRQELMATRKHLLKSWFAPEEYYRSKYKSLSRAGKFVEWSWFVILDWIWGNGESLKKLIFTVLCVFIFIVLYLISISPGEFTLNMLAEAIKKTPLVFLGIKNISDDHHNDGVFAIIYFVRLVIFGLFMSLLVKKISRR